jgi:hypothetical protein
VWLLLQGLERRGLWPGACNQVSYDKQDTSTSCNSSVCVEGTAAVAALGPHGIVWLARLDCSVAYTRCASVCCGSPPCVDARLLLLMGVAPPAQLVRVLAAACFSGVASPSSITTFLADLRLCRQHKCVHQHTCLLLSRMAKGTPQDWPN